jgi:hypothetical protein
LIGLYIAGKALPFSIHVIILLNHYYYRLKAKTEIEKELAKPQRVGENLK